MTMELFILLLIFNVAWWAWVFFRVTHYVIPQRISPTALELMEKAQAQRNAYEDATHAAWEEWWKTLTDAPVPVQKKRQPLVMSRPSPLQPTIYMAENTFRKVNRLPPIEAFPERVRRLKGE